MGAVVKDAEAQTFRVIYDASNTMHVNHRIRVRDQQRLHIAGDIAAVLRQASAESPARFAAFFDVRKAHRQVLVRRRDWGFQAARIRDSDPDVWLNTCGTFGVASASYWWSRLAAAAIRALHYLLGPSSALYALVYSDDGFLLATGAHFEKKLLMAFLVLEVLGLPLVPSEGAGGPHGQLDRVPDRCVSECAFGLSPKRAQWVIDWITARLRDGMMKMQDLREALGRLAFVSMALEHLRLLLALLFAWGAACPPQTCQRIPFVITAILEFIRDEVSGFRMSLCRPLPAESGELFRADAKAEGQHICLGGWASCDAPLLRLVGSLLC